MCNYPRKTPHDTLMQDTSNTLQNSLLHINIKLSYNNTIILIKYNNMPITMMYLKRTV